MAEENTDTTTTGEGTEGNAAADPQPTEATEAPALTAQDVSAAKKSGLAIGKKGTLTQVDALLADYGGREEGEDTMSALKRVLSAQKQAQETQTPEPQEEANEAAKLWEAQKAKMQTENEALRKSLEEQQAQFAAQARARKIAEALNGKSIAAPSGYEGDTLAAFQSSIREMIVNKVGAVNKQSIEGVEYFIDESGKPMLNDSGEAMTEAQYIEKHFAHFFASDKFPTSQQLKTMTEKQKQEVIKTHGTVNSKNDLVAKANEKYVKGSPEWLNYMKDMAKTNGIDL